jgi:glyoxylase-like metal-dependent hydrolase (beta-lactamase superfamily II)
LIGIGMEPSFAIGQRALLVRTPQGNLLWDCIPLVDPAIVELVQGIGGIQAIAISHPHFYAGMVEWSRAFNAPIYLHAADQRWVMRPDGAIEYWDGEAKPVMSGMKLIRCGGHFEGSTVLHWPAGGDGKGALLSGDTIQVVEDHRWVSFMYSYPNYIPLPVAAIKRIEETVEPLQFDRIYGAWWHRVVAMDGKNVIRRSAERYRNAIQQR